MTLTSQQIETLFDTLNGKYYGGALPRPVSFRVESGHSWYARVRFKRRETRKERTRFTLSVCPDWDWERLSLPAVILHEMVHIHNEVLGLEIKNTRAPLIGHNLAFIRECIRLRRRFGVKTPVFGWEVRFNRNKK